MRPKVEHFLLKIGFDQPHFCHWQLLALDKDSLVFSPLLSKLINNNAQFITSITTSNNIFVLNTSCELCAMSARQVLGFIVHCLEILTYEICLGVTIGSYDAVLQPLCQDTYASYRELDSITNVILISISPVITPVFLIEAGNYNYSYNSQYTGGCH